MFREHLSREHRCPSDAVLHCAEHHYFFGEVRPREFYFVALAPFMRVVFFVDWVHIIVASPGFAAEQIAADDAGWTIWDCFIKSFYSGRRWSGASELEALGVIATRFDFMGYIEEVTKITGSQLLFSLLIIAGAVCPGLLTIWNFAPQMIDNCSSFMLILLSMAITLPILAINAVAMILTIEQKHDDADLSEAGPLGIGFAACLSMLTLGIPLLVAFMASFCLKTFVWSVIGAEGLSLGLSIWAGISSTSSDTAKKQV
jgi:hypothetical protein